MMENFTYVLGGTRTITISHDLTFTGDTKRWGIRIKCNFRKNAASGEEVVTNDTDTRKQKKALMLTTEKCRVVKHLADLL